MPLSRPHVYTLAQPGHVLRSKTTTQRLPVSSTQSLNKLPGNAGDVPAQWGSNGPHFNLNAGLRSRRRRPLDIPAAGSTTQTKNAMSAYDHRSGRSFLVDCGADISLLPASPADRMDTPSGALVVTNGTLIKNVGHTHYHHHPWLRPQVLPRVTAGRSNTTYPRCRLLCPPQLGHRLGGLPPPRPGPHVHRLCPLWISGCLHLWDPCTTVKQVQDHHRRVPGVTRSPHTCQEASLSEPEGGHLQFFSFLDQNCLKN